MSWLGRRNVRPPPDVFAAVMATGIVSIAVEEHGPSVLTCALTVVAVAAFATAFVWTTRAASDRSIVAVRDRRDLDWLLRSFTFVAACTVLAARFAATTGLDWVLGAVAAAAWLVLAALAVSQVRTRSPVELRDQAHGAWLLASVATSGLAITAADLAVTTHRRGLIAIAAIAWLLAILAYLAIGSLIVGRAFSTGFHPDQFQPDTWILMGGLAIATLAGDHVLSAAEVTSASGWSRSLADLARPTTVVTWTLACLWIAPLAAASVWCISRQPVARRFANVWWAGVFPLGMFAVATQATAKRIQPTTLTSIATTFSWIAIAAWVFVAASGIRAAITAWHRPRRPDRSSLPT